MSGEAWLKLAVRTIRDPKIVTLSSDAARWAFIAILVAAKEQSPQGQFASEQHLRGVISPSVADHIVELVEAGLLEVDPDGGIAPARWRKYQVDPTGPARVAAYRARAAASVSERYTPVTKKREGSYGNGQERETETETEREKEKENTYSLRRAKKSTESIGEIISRAERIEQ